jgi:hypothetical protein
LISKEVVPKEALDNKVPVDEVDQILYKTFVILYGNLPKVDAS